MQITHAKLHHLTAPAPRVIKTSFGTMPNRHAIFLELTAETDNGTFTGWGESWINFPTWAPEERKAAFHQAYIPYLLNKELDDISIFMAAMRQTFAGPATQANTIGALVASLCAIELALWDIQAKSRNLPLSKLWFGDGAGTEIEIYASGINAPLPFDDIDEMLACGVKLFKLKLGFGDHDLSNLEALDDHLAGHAQIAVDINRGWALEQVLAWLPRLKDFHIRWLEEPLRPDQEHHYRELRAASSIPIAAGENVWVDSATSASDLARLPIHVLQPDITKNCGAHAALAVANQAATLGKQVIPHYLGSAIGQAASLHLAAGCQLPLCEWDINKNPLRTDIFTEPFTIKDGKIKLPATPGIGWTPDADAFRKWSATSRL